MKQTKKILSVLLLLCLAATMLASCGKKGGVIAVLDGAPIYESDVEDIVNYSVISGAGLNDTDEARRELAYSAVRNYVRYLAMEKDLAENGFTIDEAELKAEVNEMVAYLNENFEGGYREWRNLYLVSKNFLKEELRRYMLADLFREYAEQEIEITDEELEQYYHVNGLSYTDPAGYTWTTVFRQVLDDRDEKECAAAEDELLGYLRDINRGTMTLESVKADLLAKYTAEDGYSLIDFYSGTNFTAMADYKAVENLDAAIRELEESTGELDPNAEKNSDAYNKYMKFLGARAQTEVFYALGTLSAGEMYSGVIKSIGGYYLVRLDRVKTTGGFRPFEEVKDEIRNTLYEERVTSAFEQYIPYVENKYQVSYLFDLTAID